MEKPENQERLEVLATQDRSETREKLAHLVTLENPEQLDLLDHQDLLVHQVTRLVSCLKSSGDTWTLMLLDVLVVTTENDDHWLTTKRTMTKPSTSRTTPSVSFTAPCRDTTAS